MTYDFKNHIMIENQSLCGGFISCQTLGVLSLVIEKLRLQINVETNQTQQEIKQEKETNQQQLLDEIAKLKQRIKEQEDKEYLAWQQEREEKRKKKQSDFEM